MDTGQILHFSEFLYFARGQAENLIKQLKGQPVSDRTSCQSVITAAR